MNIKYVALSPSRHVNAKPNRRKPNISNNKYIEYKSVYHLAYETVAEPTDFCMPPAICGYEKIHDQTEKFGF